MRTLLIGIALALFVIVSLVACGVEDPLSASINGSVYFDENSDEDCDCECGIPSVSIRLYREVCGGELLEVIHTDADGNYIFENLAAGSYCIFSDLDPQCNGFMATTSISYSIDLGPSEIAELEGFGYNLFVDEVQK